MAHSPHSLGFGDLHKLDASKLRLALSQTRETLALCRHVAANSPPASTIAQTNAQRIEALERTFEVLRKELAKRKPGSGAGPNMPDAEE
jgi:hypothetical protein